MLIGTINLHGGMLFEINFLRLPKPLKEKYKSDYLVYVMNGLISMLNNERYKKYDIVACQEMPYKDIYYLQIEEKLKAVGYKIVPDRDYFKPAECISAFIVKSDLKCTPISFEMGDSFKNKFSKILVRDTEIINVHSPSNREACLNIINTVDSNKKIVLLGDFNAAKDEQTIAAEKGNEAIREEHKIFLEKVEGKCKGIQKFYEIGDDKQYTFFTQKISNKLDHVFFSKGLYETLDEPYMVKVNVHKNVNFYEDEKSGFTDHSMLEFEIDF